MKITVEDITPFIYLIRGKRSYEGKEFAEIIRNSKHCSDEAINSTENKVIANWIETRVESIDHPKIGLTIINFF